jgi:hypothetical protein
MVYSRRKERFLILNVKTPVNKPQPRFLHTALALWTLLAWLMPVLAAPDCSTVQSTAVLCSQSGQHQATTMSCCRQQVGACCHSDKSSNELAHNPVALLPSSTRSGAEIAAASSQDIQYFALLNHPVLFDLLPQQRIRLRFFPPSPELRSLHPPVWSGRAPPVFSS